MEFDDTKKTPSNVFSDEMSKEPGCNNQPPTHRKTTLALLCISCFWGGSAYSLMAPFMPQEAKRKGLSGVQTGIIFGVYQLGLFISSPLIGSYMTRLGAKFVVVLGLCGCGLSTLLLGFVTSLPPGAPFFLAAVALRATDALGGAGVITTSYAIASVVYPERLLLACGLIQTAMSVGLMVSPVIGAVLYEIGGFWLPFFVVGGFTILYGLIFQLLVPPFTDVQRERKSGVVTLLHSSLVWAMTLCIFNSAIGSMFMSPILSLHLQQFQFSMPTIGLLFLITPAFYGFSAPFWGFISDRQNLYSPLIVLGNFLAGVGVLLIGPSPLLPFLPTKIGVIAVGMAMLGCFNNCGLIPTRKCLLVGALNLGFENDLHTHGIVSGLFNSVYCLGAFVGPIVSGVANQQLGFRTSTTIFCSFFLVSSLGSCAYFIGMFFRRHYTTQMGDVALSATQPVPSEKTPINR